MTNLSTPVSRSHLFAWKSIGIFGALLSLVVVPRADVDSPWQLLAPGLELRRITSKMSAPVGKSPIVVLRMDPNLWELSFVGVSNTGESAGHTARGWAEGYKLTAAINAGMFDTDGKTHLGYARARGQVSNNKTNAYQSVAAFDPRDPKQHSQFRMFDLDDKSVSMQGILKDYASAVQNLRLIKRPGLNQWGQQEKKWSEAALGEDDKGRILFIFSRAPFSMHDLNRELLAAGIGLVAAQHLEGGPEAQLYVHTSNVELEMFGSFETGFKEDDTNTIAWPVPNVLGVRPRKNPAKPAQ